MRFVRGVGGGHHGLIDRRHQRLAIGGRLGVDRVQESMHALAQREQTIVFRLEVQVAGARLHGGAADVQHLQLASAFGRRCSPYGRHMASRFVQRAQLIQWRGLHYYAHAGAIQPVTVGEHVLIERRAGHH